MMTQTATFNLAQAGFTMTVALQQIGPDLLVVLTGGDHPHIGAITNVTATTLSSFRYPSHDGRLHQDHVLSEIIGRLLQPNLTGHCTITAGVHVNGITTEQIQAAAKMAQSLAQKVVQWLQAHPLIATPPTYY
ncbi:hypothetical protein FC83_GL003310 [Agrilactobacillus composti DSM 18527 = JCM 14202]|uniref:Prenylated flavin chaperone LpdD-like domain-containing protein n=1 Tax=Agrilactobacillus composti DSM 18527 = JCM 14202 TaxID=1423734 RepID=A0A0R1XSU5_9LACO|nr:hypothetical protein FC83_GL003310 [Agrilactobacillus composti DSM 18527 = JCM 14202]